MHRDHDTFARAIRDKRKIKLTLPSKEPGGSANKLCGPLYYSASAAEGDLGCYYLWDFESGTGNNFLGLLPSQIASMELTEEPFDLVKFFASGRESGDSQC
jgi:hypothetical protein